MFLPAEEILVEYQEGDIEEVTMHDGLENYPEEAEHEYEDSVRQV